MPIVFLFFLSLNPLHRHISLLTLYIDVHICLLTLYIDLHIMLSLVFQLWLCTVTERSVTSPTYLTCFPLFSKILILFFIAFCIINNWNNHDVSNDKSLNNNSIKKHIPETQGTRISDEVTQGCHWTPFTKQSCSGLADNRFFGIIFLSFEFLFLLYNTLRKMF